MEVNLSVSQDKSSILSQTLTGHKINLTKQEQALEEASMFFAQIFAKITKITICSDKDCSEEYAEIRLLSQDLLHHGNFVLNEIAQYCTTAMKTYADTRIDIVAIISQTMPTACSMIKTLSYTNEHVDAMFTLVLALRNIVTEENNNKLILLVKTFQNLIFCLRFMSTLRAANEQ